jgi:hypothetical protein
MRLLFLSFSVVIITGCITSGKDHKSAWAALDHAADIDCSPWPKRSKDLRIETIKPVHDAQESMQGFVVSVLTRTANQGQYFLPFKNSIDLDASKSQSIELPRGGKALGGFYLGKRRLVFTALNTSQGVQIELRTIPDNVVRGKTLLANESIEDGFIKSTKGGFWLQYEDRDNSDKLALIQLLAKDHLSVKRVPITLESKPTLVSARGGAYLVWRPDEPKAPLRYRWVSGIGSSGAGGQPGPVLNLPYRIQSQIESWTISSDLDQHMLVVVDGDTLIGQAQLVANSLQLDPGGAILKNSKQLALKDTHTTEPLIVPGDKSPEILMINWIDEESTIARYNLKGQGITRPSYMGIFAKGTKMQWLYKEPRTGTAYFLIKNKIESEWNYSLCAY